MIGDSRAERLADLLDHYPQVLKPGAGPGDAELERLAALAARLSALPRVEPDPQYSAMARQMLVEAAGQRASLTVHAPARDAGRHADRDVGRRRAWFTTIGSMILLVVGVGTYSFATETPERLPQPPAQVGPVVPTGGPIPGSGSARDDVTGGATPGPGRTGKTAGADTTTTTTTTRGGGAGAGATPGAGPAPTTADATPGSPPSAAASQPPCGLLHRLFGACG